MKFTYKGDPEIAAEIFKGATIRELQKTIDEQRNYIARLEVENKRLHDRVWAHNQESINKITKSASSEFARRHPFLSKFVDVVDVAEVQQ